MRGNVGAGHRLRGAAGRIPSGKKEPSREGRVPPAAPSSPRRVAAKPKNLNMDQSKVESVERDMQRSIAVAALAATDCRSRPQPRGHVRERDGLAVVVPCEIGTKRRRQ